MLSLGLVKKVFNNPQNVYTKMLLSSRPPKKGRPKNLPTIENKLEKHPLVSKKDREEKTFNEIYSFRTQY